MAENFSKQDLLDAVMAAIELTNEKDYIKLLKLLDEDTILVIFSDGKKLLINIAHASGLEIICMISNGISQVVL